MVFAWQTYKLSYNSLGQSDCVCMCYPDALLMNVIICMHPFHKLHMFFVLLAMFSYGAYVCVGVAELADMDGPFLKLRLKGRFWHERSLVLARLGNYLQKRIPVRSSRYYYISSGCYMSSFMENHIKSLLLTCWVIYYHTPMTVSLLYLTQSLLLLSVLLVIYEKLTDICVKYPTS